MAHHPEALKRQRDTGGKQGRRKGGRAPTAGGWSVWYQRRPVTSLPLGNDQIPGLLTRLIGRDQVVSSLVRSLTESRWVTLAGPAGIGKSTVAVAVAAELRKRFPDGGRFVDLVPLVEPSLVPSALASVLGISLSPDGPHGSLVRALRSKRVLIVLDNCEHVAAAVAVLVESLLRSCPGVTLLATSREPLRAQGERVVRLQALAVPGAQAELAGLTAKEALTYPAVELFVERAMATVAGFQLTDGDARPVAELCRRLDGIPLAIELAAARLDAFGVKELASRLDDRLRLMMKGRRTALPRQQTLRGAMDWSYETLTPRQQRVLCRLGVFPGSFDAASAAAVVADQGMAAAEVFDELTELTAKSLVTPDVAGDRARYRLLATTRAYAWEKLSEQGERSEAQRRHAERVRVRLNEIVRAAVPQPPQLVATRPLLEDRTGTLDDVRAALAWAYGPTGAPTLAIELTIAAVPFAAWFSFHAEFEQHVERALALTTSVAAGSVFHARLLLGLGGLVLHTRGSTAGLCLQAAEIWERLAEDEAELAPGLELFEGRWAEAFGAGDYAQSVQLASDLLTKTRAISPLVDNERNSERLLGIGLHFSGEQLSARPPLQRAYDHFWKPGVWRVHNPSQIDLRVSAGISLSRTLWLLGDTGAALQLADDILERATQGGHCATLCYTLGFLTCPLSFWRGDYAAGARAASRLAVEATRYGLQLWLSWARCYESVFDTTKARASDWNVMQLEMRATLRDDLVSEELLARLEQGHAGWCSPELLRARGECCLRHGDEAGAREHFERALQLARGQGTRFWELRAATSLARLWRDQGDRDGARELLEPVVARQSADVATLDLERARALVFELG